MINLQEICTQLNKMECANHNQKATVKAKKQKIEIKNHCCDTFLKLLNQEFDKLYFNAYEQYLNNKLPLK